MTQKWVSRNKKLLQRHKMTVHGKNTLRIYNDLRQREKCPNCNIGLRNKKCQRCGYKQSVKFGD